MASIEQMSSRAGQISRGARQLMVYALFTAIASGMSCAAKAQNFSEWFRQKKTQKKYLLEQIAALKVLTGYIRSGNRIAHQGLGAITRSLVDENNLHKDFYGHLKSVNPMVKNDPQVSEIITWQQDIMTRMKRLNGITGLNNPEQAYIDQVRNALLKDCTMQIDKLQQALSDGKTEMSDKERLSLIGGIHSEMSDNYRFAMGFSAQAQLFAQQRKIYHIDNRSTKQLYGIQ